MKDSKTNASPPRSVAKSFAVLVCVIGLVALSAIPAQGHVAFKYTWAEGMDYLYDGPASWNGDTYYERQGDNVVAWQGILWADGFLGSCDHARDGFAGIDGYFGPTTTDFTKFWQDYFRVPRDGVVGHGTWSVARSDQRWYASADGNASQGEYEWKWYEYQGLHKDDENLRNYFGEVVTSADGWWAQTFHFFADWNAAWMSHPAIQTPCHHS